MNSTLTLYFNSILNLDKNFALDDGGSNRTIEQYLSTLESFVVNNFQYVKHGLSISIKLEREQTALMMGKDARDLNYIKIQNGTETPMYYFIVNKTWKSVNTIELVLSLDTLNSFTFNKDYLINEKTMINRQHKDRIKITPSIFVLDVATLTFSGTTPNETQSITFDISTNKGFIFDYFIEFNGATPWPDDTYTWSVDWKTHTFSVTKIAGNWGVRVLLKIRYIRIKRDIDIVSEEIIAPTYKQEISNIIDRDDSSDWYLLYRNTQQQDAKDFINDSPVECFLMPENAVRVKSVTQSSGVIDTGTITDGHYILFVKGYNENRTASAGNTITFTIDNVVYKPSFSYYQGWEAVGEYSKYTYRILIFHNDGGTLKFYEYEYKITCKDEAMTDPVNYSFNLIKQINNPVVNITSPNSTCYCFDTTTALTTLISGWYTNYQNNYYVQNRNSSITGSTTFESTLNGVNAIDRTDSRNIKLIALPYCPISFKITNGVYEFEENWVYDNTTGFMKNSNLSLKFLNELQHNDTFTPLWEILLGTQQPTSRDTLRNDYFESKLYHSDFYRPKFVYDSFSYTFKLEQYNFIISDDPYYSVTNLIPSMDVSFIMTRTINSKFLFKFSSVDVEYKYLTEDYDHILPIARNNEETLYNSAYINYIRAGYNYDVKTLERQKEAGGIGIGLSLISSLVSIFGGVATGNYLLAGIGVATAGIGLAGQLTNLIKTTAQGEQSIQQKLDETSRQAVSVSGANDIDLLDAYSDNKAKYVIYHLSDRMKKAVGDLFYYCGYKLELQGIPNKTSRYWFNFVQCEMILTDTNNIPVEIEEDIKEKFKSGVTFFHYHNGFNFAQDKENWETTLIPYLEV